MVTLKTILLLVGTAIVSGSIRTYPYPAPFEGYGLPGDKPIIAFGVPNFYPIEAKKHCDDTVKFVSSNGQKFALPHNAAQFVFEEAKITEGPESQKPEPVVIPEAPVLPPFTLPELPFRFAIENPAPEIIVDPKLPNIIEEKQSLIPEAPVLPTLFVSSDGQKFALPHNAAQFVFEEAKIPEGPESQKPEPVVIPEAPVLPPFTLPELPFRFAIENPAPEIIVEPKLPNIIEEKQPLIPEAPVLPPLFLSEAPALVIKEGPKEDPIVIPEAPILPQLILPEVPVKFNVEKPAPVFTNIIFEASEMPKIIKEIGLTDTPEAPVLPPLSLPKVHIPITAEEPAPADIIEEAPQLPMAIEVPVIIPEAPMLPPFPLSELPVRLGGKKPVIILASPELPAPIEIIQSPEIPSIAPEFVHDAVPKTHVFFPKLHGVEPFINGRSAIIIKAPVQIVIEGGSDLARLASPDCIATILRERLIPNLVQESNKVIIPGPTSEILAVPI